MNTLIERLRLGSIDDDLLDAAKEAADTIEALQAESRNAATAMATLEQLGYTNAGGELWKPPIGAKPNFDLVDSLRAERDALQAKLDAITKEAETNQKWAFLEWRDKAEALQAEVSAFEKYLKEGETPIQRLEREIKDGHALMTVYGHALAERDALRAELDKLKAQEPVAWHVVHNEDMFATIDAEYVDDLASRGAQITPLYAGAAPQAPTGEQG